ncbi:ImmA/IrrE family metallo-endopeptidase [Burkholderia cepacia]|uniref:ImmA/IrrE family metallo-endopeptidase n=1 Tax=Burkholderia cepacia TaxID=292 RepID=UPI00075B713B|nr:ImmA/IrrE family metallo-endopeptidase [Burkholderia cepacia]KVE85447.1 toxin [Burkholderia cepacia]RRA19503.1 ImmA/IrrE family metallo-endopeptidase [Burkholderia cepacia]
MTEVWTPPRAANRLAKLAEVFSAAHGVDRFPVEVPPLAMEAARIFGWTDPIAQVQAANIKGFDGALFPGEGRKEWLLLYNEAVSSPGRVRFTQAHELGHYILHRQFRESFQCSDADMLNWSKDEKDIESQADLFASYLLMPLDDYRKQVTGAVDLDLLGHCADRYGVSLTAAILKWLQYTEEKAVLVMSNDGFINWAWSSEPAAKAGAFFRTRNNVIPVPDGALASNADIKHDRAGTQIPASIWFPNASSDTPLREMKIHAEQYDVVLSLLYLPRSADVWPPWAEGT